MADKLISIASTIASSTNVITTSAGKSLTTVSNSSRDKLSNSGKTHTSQREKDKREALCPPTLLYYQNIA